MKILTVCQNLNRGGTQRAAENFTRAYQSLGHEVAVMTVSDTGIRKQNLEQLGIPVWCWAEGTPTQKAGKEFSPDFIHIHRRGWRQPAEGELLRELKGPNCKVLETNVFGRVDFSLDASLIDIHLQISPWCLGRWRNWLGKRGDTTPGAVLPYAVDTRRFVRASDRDIAVFKEQKLGIPNDAITLGRVGQPIAAKWHPAIFPAFSRFAQNHDAYLMLLGMPKSLEKHLVKLPNSIRERVRLLRLTDDDQELSLFYSSLDCFLHAAEIGESFGLVLAEAMLCGTPIVTASRPHKDNGHINVVRHGIDGFVSASTDTLPDALEYWASNRDLIDTSSLGRGIHHRFEINSLAERAIRCGCVALECTSQSDCLTRLNDLGLTTHYSTEEMHKTMSMCIGRPCKTEILKMKLIHNPLIYRAYSSFLK